jgi:hypothetical protein
VDADAGKRDGGRNGRSEKQEVRGSRRDQRRARSYVRSYHSTRAYHHPRLFPITSDAAAPTSTPDRGAERVNGDSYRHQRPDRPYQHAAACRAPHLPLAVPVTSLPHHHGRTTNIGRERGSREGQGRATRMQLTYLVVCRTSIHQPPFIHCTSLEHRDSLSYAALPSGDGACRSKQLKLQANLGTTQLTY